MRNGETTSYGYDALKRLWTVEIAGQHKQTYTYGDYDRVSKLTELIGTRTFDKQMAYDSYGRLTTETFPSGFYTLNHYDVYGNLTEVTDGSSRSIWKASEANARGNITKEIKGAKETVYGYDEDKAQLTSMIASGVVNYSFGYDTKNNLAYRSDYLINQKELFTYDALNRLTNWDIHDATTNALLKTNSMSYDALGNIATKSDLNTPDAVTLKYELTTNPHALDSIRGNTNAISDYNLDVSYTDFRKIKTLTEGTKQYNITYGVDDQRRRTVYTSNDTTKTRYYLGDYEEESDNNGNVKKIHYLSGGAMLVQNNGVETLYYGYTDNQGSLIALTDQNGIAVEKYAYDPWGARRNPDNWQLKDTRSSFITNRGYTGHEHIDAFNIINMNGRVYDPVTAMFFSPDPLIQSPGDWMNYNRYSYVMNNPTRATDPTGYNQSARDSDQANGYDWSWGEDGGSGGSSGSGGGGGVPGGRGVFNKGTSAAWNANNSYYNNGIYFGTDSNPHLYFQGLSFYNDKLGLTQWYIKDGFARLDQIIYDYNSGSNNTSNSRDWLNNANNIATGLGLTGTGMGMVDGTFRMMKSGQISPGYYASGWSTGNQYVKATYSVSKFGTRISEGANAVNTGIAYYKIFDGTAEPLTYTDAIAGTFGGMASLSARFYGVQFPVVGEMVVVYGVARVTWDVFYDLGVNYGPRNW